MGGASEAEKNQLLMGNTLLSAAQTALSSAAERGGRPPGARHGSKTGARATPLLGATLRLTEVLGVMRGGGATEEKKGSV